MGFVARYIEIRGSGFVVRIIGANVCIYCADKRRKIPLHRCTVDIAWVGAVFKVLVVYVFGKQRS